MTQRSEFQKLIGKRHTRITICLERQKSKGNQIIRFHKICRHLADACTTSPSFENRLERQLPQRFGATYDLQYFVGDGCLTGFVVG